MLILLGRHPLRLPLAHLLVGAAELVFENHLYPLRVQIHGSIERAPQLEAEAFDRDALGCAFQLQRELVGNELRLILSRSLTRFN